MRSTAEAALNTGSAEKAVSPDRSTQDELEIPLKLKFAACSGNGTVVRGGDMAAVGRHNTAAATSAGVALVAG